MSSASGTQHDNIDFREYNRVIKRLDRWDRASEWLGITLEQFENTKITNPYPISVEEALTTSPAPPLVDASELDNNSKDASKLSSENIIKEDEEHEPEVDNPFGDI